MMHTSVSDDSEHWISVSDLMGGLMMVFLMLAVIYMVEFEIEKRKIEEVILLYDKFRTELYEDLYDEFEQDLPRWGAVLEENLTLRFLNSETLFDNGKSTLKQEFQFILKDFFPRYLAIIHSAKYQNSIVEVRIEGHTSSQWKNARDNELAYFLNMALSQARTRSTLEYLYSLESVKNNKRWISDRFTANGLSSSHLIYTPEGVEDLNKSRRVEFRLMTDAESRMGTLLEKIR
ncbi:MAG: cell envelope biogenesis protein OmpA [Gammaproteobacteria bacterium]|nr:MAG: cell envelope biogenesis protein OmpA [Gammaproteobacteria bacterium]